MASAAALLAAGFALSERRARRRIAAALGADEDYLARAGTSLRTRSSWRSFAVEQRALLDELDALEQRLPRITCPTTIVIGSNDHIVPPRSARLLAEQIPGARLVEIDGADHLLPMRRARELAIWSWSARGESLPKGRRSGSAG